VAVSTLLLLLLFISDSTGTVSGTVPKSPRSLAAADDDRHHLRYSPEQRQVRKLF